MLSSDGSPRMGKCDMYRQTELLWERLADQHNASARAVTSPSSCGGPISLSILFSWRRYVVFCRWAFGRQVEWREVLSYLDETPEVPFSQSLSGREQVVAAARVEASRLPPHRHGIDAPVVPLRSLQSEDSAIYSKRSGEFLSILPRNPSSIEEFANGVLAPNSAKRLGAYLIYLLQQRLFCWTKLLAQCITWRLSNDGERWCPFSIHELQWYRLLFLSQAREVVGTAPFLRSFIELLEKREFEMESAPELRMENALQGRSSSHSFSPTLTFSKAIAHSHLSSPTLSRRVPMLAAKCIDKLWEDLLHIPWDLLDPKRIPEKVSRRLLASMHNDHEVSPDALLGGGTGRHRFRSSSLGALLDTGAIETADMENPLLVLTTLKAKSPGVDEPHYLHVVTRVLETAGYVMLTKIRCFSVKKCYYVIPFLADFYELRDKLKKAWSRLFSRLPASLSSVHESGSGESSKMEMTDFLLQALADGVGTLYMEQVGSCLHNYARVATKHLDKFPDGTLLTSSSSSVPLMPSTAVVVSRPALSLLEKVIEPTFGVLLLLFGHSLLSVENRCFARFVIGLLKAVLERKMEETIARTRTGSRAQAQCRADRVLLMHYVNTHPTSLHFSDAS